ncbi:MAG: DAK2 domain-containing protein [Oscillospiraceae bacterium]|nr:DAK2 domain-containing protein [Oscillospiraceae bacterium]
MRQTIDGAAFRRMVISAAAAIEIQKNHINELNVFPVPDGDTGTNMSMTLNNAVADLKQAEDPSLTRAADITASALLRGARGNSGVILSLLFRGIAKELKGVEEATGARFAAALQCGVENAYKAVMKPAEGTILTVARLAAAGAQEAVKENDYVEFALQSAIGAGKIALENTMSQNPVLKKAGVVDAGGVGWISILEAMLSSLRGEDVIAPQGGQETAAREEANFSDFSTGDITFGYCTEFIVSRDNDGDPEALRSWLDSMGDSLVLVEDDEIIKVHVHTNHPGEVIEKALSYGGLVTVKIENMRLQHTEKLLSEAERNNQVAPAEKKYGMVAVCAGDGLSSVFKDLGADQVIKGGQTMNPSTQDIAMAINHTPAETVFVFPNNKNIIMAAEQAQPLTEKQVVVVRSRTIPQGISAMLAFDPEASVEDNLMTMREARHNVSTMQITYAARNSDFDGFAIHKGDYLALYGSALFGTSRDVNSLLKGLAEKIAGEGKEIITIFYGEDIDEKTAEKTLKIFEKLCPDAEISLINGGQPVYYYLISAE